VLVLPSGRKSCSGSDARRLHLVASGSDPRIRLHSRRRFRWLVPTHNPHFRARPCLVPD
jgi:hypothetical protein